MIYNEKERKIKFDLFNKIYEDMLLSDTSWRPDPLEMRNENGNLYGLCPGRCEPKHWVEDERIRLAALAESNRVYEEIYG